MNSEIFLIEELKNENKNVYHHIFASYYSPLVEYASQYVYTEDAEEIVQDIMLNLWIDRHSLEINISLRSYLFGATKNRCLNAIRNAKTKQRIHTFIYENLKDDFQNIDNYFPNELSHGIERAIKELPDNYQEAFKLSRFTDLTNKQIADKLDVSIKTIEYRITQSLKLLRKKLKDYL